MRLPVVILLAAASAFGATPSSSRTSVSLSGQWSFFPDYPASGEAFGWHKPDADVTTWDTVEVPHIWNLEPRYAHTGPAWYRRSFTAPPLPAGHHARLRFGAVFYKCKVWLNGVLLGEHEGGYTAFDLDAGSALRVGAQNQLAVMVDNSWSTETLPGNKLGITPQQLTYPWWNYGGIKKPVWLEIAPDVYLANQKVTAVPDLASNSARVSVKVWVRNTTSAPQSRKVRVRLRRPGAWDAAGEAESTLRIEAGKIGEAEFSVQLPAPVALWDFDHPNLYESLVEVAGDSEVSRFGIRKLEIRDARLLLNGEAVAFGGANRSADHPKYGSMENDEVIQQDMAMMKSANMGLARILHYPPSQNLLDWCDEHGFLIIAEAGNWGLTPTQMDSPKIRALWQSQAREMIEQSWNHPAVIGWSVGNEYDSDSPAGVRWTRDMLAFTRALDSSRFHTFISLGGKIFSKVKPEENSFHYADILCVNIYGNGRLDEAMKVLHTAWPQKPVLISEFGWRADSTDSEASRAQEFRQAIAILRKHPFVIGASVWSWNDYLSRHFRTNPDGYRRWGLVTPGRTPRESYYALREEFAPLTIGKLKLDRRTQLLSANFALLVTLEGRSDFPSRILRDHEAVVTLMDSAGQAKKRISQPVPEIQPGKTQDLTIPVSAADLFDAASLRFEVRQPTGFTTLERTIPLRDVDKP